MKQYTGIMAKVAMIIAVVTVLLKLTNILSTKWFTIMIVLVFIIWAICTYLEGTHRKKGDKTGWVQMRKNALRGKKEK